MRIAFIEPHLEVYGGIRRIVTMASLLHDRGHDVVIYHSDGSPCRWMECRAPTRPIGAARASGADVALFNYPPDLPHALGARARHTVFYVLGLYRKELVRRRDPRIFLLRRFWHERWLARCLGAPFHFAANATWMSAWVRETTGRPCEPLLGGIDHALFAPRSDSSRATDGLLRREPAILLASGDPRPEKGGTLLARAVELVRCRWPSVTLETYHGRALSQPELAASYRKATLFLDTQSSRAVGWNNPIAEAMASGTPVVGLDVPGNRELLVNGVTGLAVPDEPRAYADATLALLADASLRERLALAAERHTRSFSWARAIDRLEDLLARLASGRPSATWTLAPPAPSTVHALGELGEASVLCPPGWRSLFGVAHGAFADWPGEPRSAEQAAIAPLRAGARLVCAGPLHEAREPGRMLAELLGLAREELIVLTPRRDFHGPQPANGGAFPFSEPELEALVRALPAQATRLTVDETGWQALRLWRADAARSSSPA